MRFNFLKVTTTITTTTIATATTTQWKYFSTRDLCYFFEFLAEGRQAEPHSYHAKEKETHELIFSWLSWLSVLLVGAYARRRRRRRRSRATWRPYSKRGWQRHRALVYCVLHLIGHQRYDQLTPVKTGYPLTSITWPYRGLKITAHRGHVFFKVDRWPIAGFLIGSRAHVRLTFSQQGRIVLKNRIITFSSIKMLKIQD